VPTVVPKLRGGCKYRYSFLRASSRTLGYWHRGLEKLLPTPTIASGAMPFSTQFIIATMAF
jgi:hypothetical protein